MTSATVGHSEPGGARASTIGQSKEGGDKACGGPLSQGPWTLMPTGASLQFLCNGEFCECSLNQKLLPSEW